MEFLAHGGSSWCRPLALGPSILWQMQDRGDANKLEPKIKSSTYREHVLPSSPIGQKIWILSALFLSHKRDLRPQAPSIMEQVPSRKREQAISRHPFEREVGLLDCVLLGVHLLGPGNPHLI